LTMKHHLRKLVELLIGSLNKDGPNIGEPVNGQHNKFLKLL